jgi:hypothetical protein
MFFRGRSPETSVWRRFRSAADGFQFTEESGLYTAHVVANAERVADLFHALLEHMPPAVDLSVEDKRSGRSWTGERLPLPDVRDAIARMKVPLASLGGVEIACFTAEDQVTLNPVLELFIYARTDRWSYILRGKGLEEHRRIRTRSWKLARRDYPPAPELVEAIEGMARSLGLTAA